MTDDKGLAGGHSEGDGEKWLESGHILMVAPTGWADELDGGAWKKEVTLE